MVCPFEKNPQLRIDVSLHINPAVTEHAEAKKKATMLKRSGNIEFAIKQCRIAAADYEAIYGPNPSPGKFSNTLPDYFKLARYLAEAGRVEEAWAVLSERLDLAKDIRNNFGRAFVPISCSQVYGEMRKLAAKTGDYSSALKYATVEMVAWDQGLMLQGRSEELPELPIEVEDLPRYIKTYCSRLKTDFTVEDFAAFINSVYERANGRFVSIDLETLQDELIQLVESAE